MRKSFYQTIILNATKRAGCLMVQARQCSSTGSESPNTAVVDEDDEDGPTNAFEARLKAIEQQMHMMQDFIREVEVRSPSLAAEVAASVKAKCSAPSASESNVRTNKDATDTDGSHQALDAGLLEDLYEFYGLQPIELWAFREFTRVQSVEELIHLAAHVHREYLVRLAHRARSLRQAPLGLAQMPSIRELRNCYETSFADMRKVERLESREDLIAFDAVVRRILARHGNTADLLSNGLYEFASREQILAERKLGDTSQMKVYREVQSFFDAFCDTRVRLRFMLGHHAALSAKLLADALPEGVGDRMLLHGHDSSTFVGHICTATDARKVVLSAINDSRESEVENTSLIPPIELRINQVGVPSYTYTGEDSAAHGVPFVYHSVPHILFGSVTSMVGEAIRANVIRKLRLGIDGEPIKVEVTQGESLSDVTVSVTDTAGGLPLPILKTSLTCVASCRAYLEEQELCKKGTKSFNRIGCGWSHCPIRMPYAAVASRVFGGDVNISSLEGVGTSRNVFVPTDESSLDDILI